ncbi:UvrD-helicase domain-containing protein [Rhizobium sullae]|uniref:DNA 3'-5' helicase n=1 Tax=Rhizobium sullae TaxID=50338 RepID=A0A4R3Q8Z8_RHISU|nr:UvrD-helicase domain-containing protein [Rhizobium sullae]TCU17890.1 AAA domain-containing protein [Rhizobium sullae]
MKRPFVQFSFKDLQAEFKRAKRVNDTEALSSLRRELEQRKKNPNAPLLLADVLKAIAEIGPEPQGDFFREPKPSANGSNRQRVKHTQPAASRTAAPKYKPTAEQGDAVDAFVARNSLKINAYAGTGKTSTLQMLANATGARGQYIAFNKDIVTDAKDKFPNTVNCSTSHSLAMRATPSGYKQDMSKLTGKVNTNQLVEMLGLKREKFDQSHLLQPRSQAFLMLETVKKFAQSADPTMESTHVPVHGALRAASPETAVAIREFALEGARFVWKRMLDERDPLPLGHDGYLKLWGLSQPTIAADFILLDEAQDTNPVVLDVLRRQAAQMIYVGDRYQQIYEWRGAINAMEEVQTNHTTFLTTSFRFGDTIAAVASQVLGLLGETRSITGNPGIRSRLASVSSPNAILAWTNASTIAAVIEALDQGQKPHLVGGNKDLMDMLRGVQALKAGEPSDVADFFGFANWNEVVEFSRTDEGAHLVTFVNLVESRGEKQLMWALNHTVGVDEGTVVISTAHKAKGREWTSVRLMDDFMKSKATKTEKVGLDAAELRLLYVAITRAKELLDIPLPLADLIAGRPAEPARAVPVRPNNVSGKPVSIAASAKAPAAPAPKHFTPPPRSVPPREVRPMAQDERRPKARPKRTGLMRWLLGE